MIIAYLIDYDINVTSGVVQKILQQSQKWIDAGHTVYLISTKTLSVYDQNKEIIFQEKSLKISFGRVGTAMKLLHSSIVINKLLKQIKFDILYMRYRLYMPFFTKVLKKYKVIMEINSDDTLEYKLHSKITHLYNKFTRDMVLKYIDGFVSVSDELKTRFEYLNNPIEVIANGINTSLYDIVKHQNKKFHLVFIGTPNQPWHGLNKIIDMAHYFKEYQFNIIGTDGVDIDNIKYFGYLNQDESTKIIQKCDIGIGTLSLYKTGLTEASPLKTRQYLACGIPMIYGYKDTDLNDDTSFSLQLENTKDNLDYKKIKDFIDKTVNKYEIKEEARKFSKEILDYSVKEKRRLEFFKKVLDE